MRRADRIKHRLSPATWPTEEAAAAALLFQPIDVGPVRLAQRTWVPAMVPWRATEGGEVTEALLAWYGRFAQGRPGAIVVEATGIRDIPSGPLLRIGDDRFLPGLRRLVEVVKENSGGQTKLFIQLIDFLAVKRRPAPDKFFARFLRIEDHHRAGLAKVLEDPAWLSAEAQDVRSTLARLDDSALDAILTRREQEDLRFGYRERVDGSSPAAYSRPAHRAAGVVCCRCGSGGAGRVRRGRASFRPRVHDGVLSFDDQ